MNRCLILILATAAVASPSRALGLYNYYGGYGTSTATSVNGWNYYSSGYSWSWGTGASVYAYTNTYPQANSQSAAGWFGASASAYSAAAGRSASAYASGYNAGFGWWNNGGYFNSVASTRGAPAYATAYARPLSYWSYNYVVPRTYWYNSYYASNGGYIPYYLNYWHWGWFDPPGSKMAMETNLLVGDELTGQVVLSFRDGFRHVAGCEFAQIGKTFNPSDMQCTDNVGGTGNVGFNIKGHDGTANESPYQLQFQAKAKVIADDGKNVTLQTNFFVDGTIGQPTPEPANMALMGGCLAILGLARRRMRRQSPEVRAT